MVADPPEEHVDTAGPQLDGGGDEPTGAGGVGQHRVIALGSTDQDETGGRGHLDEGLGPLEPPAGLDRHAEGARHRGALVGSAQHLERPLASVGQGHRDRLATGGPHRRSRGPELLLLVGLAYALAVAWATAALGFSLEMGAFLAGFRALRHPVPA